MSRTPHLPQDIPADTPFLRLRELGEAAGLLEQVMAGRLGLARTDLGVASLLAMHGPRSAGQLAEATGLTTGAVTGCLDRLERVGFARRSADPGDRRRVMVTLRLDRLGPMFELNQPLVMALSALDAELAGAQRAMVADYVRRAAGHFRAVALRLRGEGRSPAKRKVKRAGR
jgi:DNA-binding MarR family transcriptional regulator